VGRQHLGSRPLRTRRKKQGRFSSEKGEKRPKYSVLRTSHRLRMQHAESNVQQLQQTGILFMQTQQTQPAFVMAAMQSQLA
jgi:hypothetical protein